MFIAAAEAVADQITPEDYDNGLIYPLIDNIREVSLNVALKVAEEIFRSGHAGIEKPANLKEFIKSKMYEPVYR